MEQRRCKDCGRWMRKAPTRLDRAGYYYYCTHNDKPVRYEYRNGMVFQV